MNAMSRASWSIARTEMSVWVWGVGVVDIEFWLAMSIRGKSQQDSIIRGLEYRSLPRA